MKHLTLKARIQDFSEWSDQNATTNSRDQGPIYLSPKADAFQNTSLQCLYILNSFSNLYLCNNLHEIWF